MRWGTNTPFHPHCTSLWLWMGDTELWGCHIASIFAEGLTQQMMLSPSLLQLFAIRECQWCVLLLLFAQCCYNIYAVLQYDTYCTLQNNLPALSYRINFVCDRFCIIQHALLYLTPANSSCFLRVFVNNFVHCPIKVYICIYISYCNLHQRNPQSTHPRNNVTATAQFQLWGQGFRNEGK